MIAYLKGLYTELSPTAVTVECAGVGYAVSISLTTYSALMGQREGRLLITEIIREDAHLLYGFRSEDEKKLFLSLISVSGIGPVSALAIIAADDNAGLVQAIETKNITYLTKFPKIGKKTAQQMVLDLEGKVVVAGDDLPAKTTAPSSSDNQELEEAMEAMLALGYKATELKKIKKFFEGTSDTAENYIKSALKMLVK